MRIAFFGTPEFAVPSLRALLGEGFPVVAVVTQPDKPHGRSRSRTVPPPVKIAAEREGIAVYQPTTPRDASFMKTIEGLNLDLGVVVAYGHILRPELLAIPTLGMINVHASLLPELRGAAPIQHAILTGTDETGVSIMQMEKGMDSGPVMLRVPTPIAPDETFGELTVRLAEVGALALIQALTLVGSGNAEPTEQDHSRATMAPKITRETAKINWHESGMRISRLIRAMDPAPGAWALLDNVPVKFFGPRLIDSNNGRAPGTVIRRDDGFAIAAKHDAIQFMDLQPAGRKRMPAASWLRGFPKDSEITFR